MHRRMEDRIRDLCEQAIAEQDPGRLRRIHLELRDVLHQHIGRLRKRLFSPSIAAERRERRSKIDPKNL
jgi:hypothetical protein